MDSYYDDQLECWIRKDGDDYILGITDWTQGYIGDISQLYIEVHTGITLEKGSPFAIVESDKTSIELHLPISGTVTGVNNNLLEDPSLINRDCYARSKDKHTSGWILRFKSTDIREIEQLLTPDHYRKSVDSFFKKGD